MARKRYPKWFLDKLKAIKGKRARTVIDHILKHGSVSTEELKDLYNYDHAPRAARDVRELGIALTNIRVQSKTGRSIVAYTFSDPKESKGRTLAGRKILSKELKRTIAARDGQRCAVCTTPYEGRYLQIDHCVPYEIQGDSHNSTPDEFMLLCGSCNRAKSWSCEHCENWRTVKDPSICRACYWASPTDYKHVAQVQIRRADIVWQGDEVADHAALLRLAKKAGCELPVYVKRALRERVQPPVPARESKHRI